MNTSNWLGSSRLLALVLRARVLLGAALIGAAVFTSGCVAVVAAAGAGAGVLWVRGAIETNLDRDLDRVYRATQDAVADLQFAKVSERKSGLDAQIIARTALDKKIDIKLEKLGSATKVTIRVGMMGDQQLSISILDRIKSHL
jgi:hypothetical protein